MDIKAEFYGIHVSEAEKSNTHTWGIANVVCNGIVIPNIRAINRKMENGEWKSFFAYPRIKVGERYQDVVRLTQEQKKEIEAVIQVSIKEFLLKSQPEVVVNKIRTFPEEQGGLVAIADVTVNGLGISGVRLYLSKEGSDKFAQLPQYQDKNGNWHNLINFDNSMFAMPELTRVLIEHYEEEKKLQKPLREKGLGI